jgi:hypothetical protein
MEFGLTVGFPCALYALCPPKLKKGLNCVTCYVKCIERDIGDLVFPEAQDRVRTAEQYSTTVAAG